MIPLYYDGHCDPECPFLINPGNVTAAFSCVKYGELDYYDWVLQHISCYKENVDPTYEPKI